MPAIKPYNEADWAKLADVRIVPTSVSLNLLEALHERWVTLLRSMSGADFERCYVHPEHERPVPMREAVTFACWPPGPEERLARRVTSARGMTSARLIRSPSWGPSSAVTTGAAATALDPRLISMNVGVASDVAVLAAGAQVHGIAVADVAQLARGGGVDAGERALAQALD